jgi:TetR/AcrR family transcriptional regulator
MTSRPAPTSKSAPAARRANDPARRRRQQQRAVATRENILAVALVEFATHGFRGVSTRTVAARAGVQHPLVNYHFKDKEGLWRAVIKSTGGRFIQRFQARLAELSGIDDVARLRLVQEEFIRFSARNLHFHLLMSQEAQRTSKQLSWLVRELVKPYFDELVPLIRSAQRAGRYVEGDPHHLQYLFIGAATRIFTLAGEVKLITGQSPFSPKLIEDHVATCLALFFRDPGNATRDAGRTRTRPSERPRRKASS